MTTTAAKIASDRAAEADVYRAEVADLLKITASRSPEQAALQAAKRAQKHILTVNRPHGFRDYFTVKIDGEKATVKRGTQSTLPHDVDISGLFAELSKVPGPPGNDTVIGISDEGRSLAEVAGLSVYSYTMTPEIARFGMAYTIAKIRANGWECSWS